MNNFEKESLRILRSAYRRISLRRDTPVKPDITGQMASDLIKQTLASDRPCMICRFGSVELNAILKYVDINDPRSAAKKSLDYIRGEIGEFWWDERTLQKMQKNAGFFPATDAALNRFCQRILEEIKGIDILASWQQEDIRLRKHFPEAGIVHLRDLNPWTHKDPWSHALKGKRVLVVHPFSKTIAGQYKKRELLFDNKTILPEFELITLKAVQSIGGTQVPFTTWFDALDYMCNKISNTDFDVAIIGAGAYGMPLASFVKSIGKKAVHLGGVTQMLFGIRGKRWDKQALKYNLYNEHWVRASQDETPDNFKAVEKGCYW